MLLIIISTADKARRIISFFDSAAFLATIYFFVTSWNQKWYKT